MLSYSENEYVKKATDEEVGAEFVAWKIVYQMKAYHSIRRNIVFNKDEPMKVKWKDMTSEKRREKLRQLKSEIRRLALEHATTYWRTHGKSYKTRVRQEYRQAFSLLAKEVGSKRALNIFVDAVIKRHTLTMFR